MDPNQALKEILEFANAVWLGYKNNDGAEDVAEDAADLACRVLDLNTWLERGGALPDNWSR